MKRALLPILGLLTLGLSSACVGEPPTGLLSGATGTTGSGSSGSKGATTGAAMSTGAGTGGAGGMAPVADYTISIDKPDATLTLASELTMTVSIDPKGYVGDILLGASSLTGEKLTTSFGKTMLTLDGSSVEQTTFTIESVSASKPGTTAYTLTAASEAGNATTAGAVTVLSEITVVIPKNVGAFPGGVGDPYTLAFGDYPMRIAAPAGISAANPVVVRFYNDDSVPHEIHAGQAGAGFGHGQGPIAPGSMDSVVRSVNAAGTYDYYLHDEGAAETVGRIVIE